MNIKTSPPNNELDSSLGFIAGGQAIKLLANPNGRKVLDELLKQELIELDDEKIILTTQGSQALKLGVNAYLQKLPEEGGIPQMQVPARKESKVKYLIFLLPTIFLIVLLLVFRAGNSFS